MFAQRQINPQNNPSDNVEVNRLAYQNEIESLSKQFMRACATHNRTKIEELLRRRKDRKIVGSFSDNNQSPLHYAVLENDPAAVQAVLVYQRNINLLQAEYTLGRTALALACSLPDMHPDIIADILEARPRAATIVDYRSQRPLDLLWANGRYDLFKIFAERTLLHISDISSNPVLIFNKLLLHVDAWRPIFYTNKYPSHWRKEIIFTLFHFNDQEFNKAIDLLAQMLPNVNDRHQKFFIMECSLAIREYSKNVGFMTEARMVARKIFKFMNAIKDSKMFLDRVYLFKELCNNLSTIDENIGKTIALGARPFIKPITSLASVSTYNVMRETLPFKFLRQRDIQVQSLKSLARDAVRSTYPSDLLSKDVVNIYENLKKILPKQIACFILHIQDVAWVED